jgi:hypothetical protein
MATAVRESVWLFPAIETLHLFGLIAVVGSTALLDVRLLGLGLKRQRVSRLAERTLRWTWTGFAIMVVTGFLLFSSGAGRYYENAPFRFKLLMIVVAGLNALVFQLGAYRRVGAWDANTATPMGAKVAGAASLLLWCGIVLAGRWIAYF